ncbi:uncharacterized protein LOC143037749 [Oratosquilla oratoria]|uniref:uncharacterized protein LOC143037749 n=1 Tax=Oratosquilla oratoria TaxID=337810 RepID=UPI003F777DCB
MGKGVLIRGRQCYHPYFAFRVSVPSLPKKVALSIWILLLSCIVLTSAIIQDEAMCHGAEGICHYNVSGLCDEVSKDDISCDHQAPGLDGCHAECLKKRKYSYGGLAVPQNLLQILGAASYIISIERIVQQHENGSTLCNPRLSHFSLTGGIDTALGWNNQNII